jgi:glycosyltransferase involved in cell wall biosynthesis
VTTVHFIVPAGIDDPRQPSGGNRYDRTICRGLTAMGWSVRERAAAGSWPCADAGARARLAGLLARIPDGAPVLLDGLIASAVPEVLVPEASRLRMVVLVHMPLGHRLDGHRINGHPGTDARDRECAVLSAAVAVVTTSGWTRRWLINNYALPPSRVHAAAPGVDVGELAPGTSAGGELLCVAAVTPSKGHEVLLAALASITDLAWRCVCVGALDRDPQFVARLSGLALEAGIRDRVVFTGPLPAGDLDVAYGAADVLVLPSRAETYGMVVTESLARGLPVVATAVGGVPEALGRTTDGCQPGLLVPAGDPASLATALRCWLGDAELRQRLRDAAIERRRNLPDWSATSARVARVLAEVAP